MKKRSVKETSDFVKTETQNVVEKGNAKRFGTDCDIDQLSDWHGMQEIGKRTAAKIGTPSVFFCSKNMACFFTTY